MSRQAKTTSENIFKGVKVRTFRDDEEKKWWFCAVDLCAVITGCDLKKAQEYWYSTKRNLIKNDVEIMSKMQKLKVKCADGRLRFSDVLDTKQVMYLIMVLPHKSAEPYRQWLAEAAATGDAVRHLERLAKKNASATLQEIARVDEPFRKRVVERRRLV